MKYYDIQRMKQIPYFNSNSVEMLVRRILICINKFVNLFINNKIRNYKYKREMLKTVQIFHSPYKLLFDLYTRVFFYKYSRK